MNTSNKLHLQGLLVSFYWIDSWQGGKNYSKSLWYCVKTLTLLQDSGFMPNMRKSQLIQAQVIEILGNIVNSINVCVRLPKKKEIVTLELITETMNMSSMSICHVACLIGKLISCTEVCPLGSAYYS